MPAPGPPRALGCAGPRARPVGPVRGAYRPDPYLVAFSLAITATAFLVAPVSAHRLLFRRRAKASLVTFGDRCARAGLGCLALSVSTVTFLIFDVVAGDAAAVTAAALALALFVANWVVVPLGGRRGHPVHRPPH